MEKRVFENTFEGCKERALDCLSYMHYIARDQRIKSYIEGVYSVISNMNGDEKWCSMPKHKLSSNKFYSETLPEMVDFSKAPKIKDEWGSGPWHHTHKELRRVAEKKAGTTYYFRDDAYARYTQTLAFLLAKRLDTVFEYQEEVTAGEYCPICDGVGTHSLTCFNRKR